MVFSDDEVKYYLENGFIIKKILSEDDCDKINKFVDTHDKYAYYEANSNKKFGYKFNDNEASPINDLIKKNLFINDFGKKILKNFDFSVIRSYYKSELMARDIEYHQEYYYNPLHPSRENWRDYVQIFLALDDHTLENACLKIIPKSHLLGNLKHVDIVNSNLEHKRSVEYNTLKEACIKYDIKNCELKKGEAIFFNHLIVHGSQNNNSPFSRRTLVSTLYLKGLEINNNKNEEFLKFRKEFVINKLNKKIQMLL